MEPAFWNGFAILSLGFLFSISLVNPSPKEYFRDFFNLYSYDAVRLMDAKYNDNCTSCPFVYFPICADDNKTYINECKLNCKNTNRTRKAKFVRTGPCKVFPEYRRIMFSNHTIGIPKFSNHSIYIKI